MTPHVPKEDQQKLPEKRGKAGKPVIKGASGRAKRDNKSPPVLQRRGGHKKKKVPALSKYELAGDL